MNKGMNMKVYLVMAEYRGAGQVLIGVYASEKKANQVASEGRYMSVLEEELIVDDVDSDDIDYSRRELRNRQAG